ncbi:RNA polymerase sigma factor [Ktedonospora formicarum]|uniref:RNA polymerase subunit sigma n=1 Tax=Ktedonospora formicarum TaxID=2778364 RepID=A0A8J3HVB2_9CHLR|nr:sigma-70 family RNA polymerase sigma factor [Ktedonospora formicarum]GHO44717.1 RNA polymerase subunit sigma [Ktedonospora formicarum]
MTSQRSVALDRTHLAYLYQQFAPKILDYVYKHVSSFQDAEDILIDVFVAALKSSSFTSLAEKEQLAWLWRVARNKIVDFYRRAQRAPRLPLGNIDEQLVKDTFPTPEQISIQQEEGDNLALLIERFSPLQQQVLYLRFSENLRCAQIAARVGKREGSIRSLLSRALNPLRRHYHEQEKGGTYFGPTQ